MTKINDGGPAFPKSGAVDANGNILGHEESGMSLRDYFAAAVLRSFAGTMIDDAGKTCEQRCAEACYRYADAMLRAREPT